MFRNRWCFSYAAIILALGVIDPSSVGAAEKAFNASIWFPDGHPLTKLGYIDWAKSLLEESKGNLKAKVFTGSVLLDGPTALNGIRDGIAQVGYHAGTYTPAQLPEDNVIAQLALNYSDYFLAALATTDFNMTDPEALAQWKNAGIVYGGGYATVPYVLFCTRPVKTLADLKGKKVRMPGAAHSNWAKSVGAVPVNVSSGEMYSGLEKGQLDCASNGANELKTRSLWEVAKHVTMIKLGVYYSGFQYGFNRSFWKGISPAERRTMLDTIAVAMVRTGIGYQKLADEVVKEAPSHGVNVIQPGEDLEKSVVEYAGEAHTYAVKLGKDRFQMKDPAGLIDRFEQKAAKWQRLLSTVDQSNEKQLTNLVKRELFDHIDVQTYGVN